VHGRRPRRWRTWGLWTTEVHGRRPRRRRTWGLWTTEVHGRRPRRWRTWGLRTGEGHGRWRPRWSTASGWRRTRRRPTPPERATSSALNARDLTARQCAAAVFVPLSGDDRGWISAAASSVALCLHRMRQRRATQSSAPFPVSLFDSGSVET